MKLEIRNFRSVKNQTIEIAPITLIYGANGAGKSSVLYALLTLKNILINPNQTTAGLFNYYFASLGDFTSVVFNHDASLSIELGFDLAPDTTTRYSALLGKSGGRLGLNGRVGETGAYDFSLPVSFPYPANQQIDQMVSVKPLQAPKIKWNGVFARVEIPPPVAPTAGLMSHVLSQMSSMSAADRQVVETAMNLPQEMLRTCAMVPLKRGFSKPFYSSVPVSPAMVSEDEVASMLAATQSKYLVHKISTHLERTLGRDFRISHQGGTSVFSLDCIDKQTGVSAELVNEGYGVNQLVYLLAKALDANARIVCVEEPEIHMHPSAIRQMARTFLQIAREEKKHFVITTHSEALLASLLALVATGDCAPAELACYHADKRGKETIFERQAVLETGQIEGGLTSFIQGEMEDMKLLLGLR